MATNEQAASGLVLRKDIATERFLRLLVLSPDHGEMVVMLRQAKSDKATVPHLDLFDQIEFRASQPFGSQVWFLKDGRTVLRHAAIGKSYKRLEAAAKVADFFARNLRHAEAFQGLHGLCSQAFSSFEAGGHPGVVLFKTMYVFSRDEGYPVKEAWLPALPVAQRRVVIDLLKLPAKDHPVDAASLDLVTGNLARWLNAETAIICDL